MAESKDFGALVTISAEAVGQPGQRRFRVRMLSANGDSATCWMEKEQLTALRDALSTILKDEGYSYVQVPLDDRAPDPALPLNSDTEFQTGQLSVGVNREAKRAAVIAAGRPESGEGDVITVSAEFDFRRAYEFCVQISEVVNAGRPSCPLCSGPIDPAGHMCVKTNGHKPH